MAGRVRVSLRDRVIRSWPSVLSAGLVLLAFPPFNLGLLVFVGLVPWLISLRGVTGKQAWRSGYGFGFVYGLGQLYWIAQLTGHWVGSIALGIVPWVLATILYAIYFGWAAVLMRHCWARDWPWAIPLVWAGIEAFRSYIPMFAFPWGLLATPLWPYTPLIQSAHYGSIYFVGAWVLLANVVVALLVSGAEYRQLRLLGAGFFLVAALSIAGLGREAETEKFPVTVGQPGVDLAFGDRTRQAEIVQDNVGRIAAKAAEDGSKLLVLPEGLMATPRMPPVLPFVRPPDLPVLLGGQRGTGPVYQSAFAFDGRRWQYADKTHLVIFGEYVPGRETFPFIAEAFHMPSGDMVPGKEGVKAFDISGTKVGPVICFEALFPDVAFRQALNDSRLLAVISVDDWFMDGNAPDQLKAGTVWRAVETGLPVVRSATQGATLACDGHGRILAELPMLKPGGLRIDIPLPKTSPTFRGLAIFPLATVVFALAIPWIRSRGKRG